MPSVSALFKRSRGSTSTQRRGERTGVFAFAVNDALCSRSAEADAERFASHVRNVPLFTVYGQGKLSAAFAEALISKAAGDRLRQVLIFYAGPARTIDGKLLLGGSSSDGAATCVDLAELLKNVCTQMEVEEILLVVDAPRRFDFEGVSKNNAWDAEDLAGSLQLNNRTGAPCISALFGCSSDEFCWESSDKEGAGGLFTVALMRVLAKHLTFRDRAELVHEVAVETEILRNVAQAPAPQTPVLVRLSPDMKSAVAAPHASTSPERGTGLTASLLKSHPRLAMAAVATLTLLLFAVALITRQPNAPKSTALSVPPTLKPVVQPSAPPESQPDRGREPHPATPETTAPQRMARQTLAPIVRRALSDRTVAVSAPTMHNRPPVGEIGPPHFSLYIFAGGRIVSGAQRSLSDDQINNLAFSVHYEGPKPAPPNKLRVEWWVNGERSSPNTFPPGDTTYSSPHLYDNKVQAGHYEVKLLIDDVLSEVVKFQILGGAP